MACRGLRSAFVLFFATFCSAVVLLSGVGCLAAFGQEAGKKADKSNGTNGDDHGANRPYRNYPGGPLNWDWNQRGRTVPSESVAGLRFRAYQQKMAMRARRAASVLPPNLSSTHPPTRSLDGTAASPSVSAGWTAIGPAPLASDATGDGGQDYNWVSGRATTVVIDPADSSGNTVLLGGAYGGLWRSTNAGSLSSNPAAVTWNALIDDQSTLAVGAVALQPGNSNVILVGTGETNSSDDSYYGLGILRSTNGGSSWTDHGDRTNSGPIFCRDRIQQDCIQHRESQPGGSGYGWRQRVVPRPRRG